MIDHMLQPEVSASQVSSAGMERWEYGAGVNHHVLTF
jgi:hypothetical protein